MTDKINIYESADWTTLGWRGRSERPGPWVRDRSGKLQRSEMIPFGIATQEYRDRWYTCSDCRSPLLPTNVRYRYGCTGCGLVFGTGFGSLWGYAPWHEKAMFLTDSIAGQSES